VRDLMITPSPAIRGTDLCETVNPLIQVNDIQARVRINKLNRFALLLVCYVPQY